LDNQVETIVWDTLLEIQYLLENSFSSTGKEIQEPGMDRFNQKNWVNRVWTSDIYRRAHIDVVDSRDTKGLWMMHCCIFPHVHNPAPIYGFDVIAGKNKITGCFHDFSSAGDPDHPMINWFGSTTAGYQWKKERQLPEWARAIFSPFMIAAGNVHDGVELIKILEISKTTTDYYLSNVGSTNNSHPDTTEYQNFYCDHQRQNPHTPRVMTSLGLSADDVAVFIEQCLFPTIQP
jgi:phycocyanobilin:ferredoxin oxidoreductase